MELIYVLCHVATAGICEEHRAMVFAESPLACVFSAPAELARIAPPGWRVARWRCEPDQGRERAVAANLDPAAR